MWLCVYLDICVYRGIHIYEWVCMYVLYFSFAWACGGISTFCCFFFLSCTLLYFTVVNSWSNLRSHCCLSRKIGIQVRLRATVLHLGPDPPSAKKPLRCAFGSGQASARVQGFSDCGESAPATRWKSPKSKTRVSFFSWEPLILHSSWGNHHLGFRLEPRAWKKWNEYVKIQGSRKKRERGRE